MPTRPTHSERAMTLVELVLVAAMGLILLAGVVSLLGDSRNAADRSARTDDAARAVESTRARLTSDLRAARPLQGGWPGAWDELRSDMRSDTPAYRDVITARPDELVVRADVSGTAPGAECVRYGIEGGQFVRAIHRGAPNGSCAPGLERREALMTLPAGSTGVFSYVLLQHPAFAAGPVVNDPSACTRTISPSPSALGIAQIVAVRLNASELLQRRRSEVRDELDVELAIRGRNHNTYLQALGCAT